MARVFGILKARYRILIKRLDCQIGNVLKKNTMMQMVYLRLYSSDTRTTRIPSRQVVRVRQEVENRRRLRRQRVQRPLPNATQVRKTLIGYASMGRGECPFEKMEYFIYCRRSLI